MLTKSKHSWICIQLKTVILLYLRLILVIQKPTYIQININLIFLQYEPFLRYCSTNAAYLFTSRR